MGHLMYRVLKPFDSFHSLSLRSPSAACMSLLYKLSAVDDMLLLVKHHPGACPITKFTHQPVYVIPTSSEHREPVLSGYILLSLICIMDADDWNN